MKCYFDTSVIGTLVFRDRDWVAVRAWIATTTPSLTYSDFGFGELASAVGRRVRMRQIGAPEGDAVLADFSRIGDWSRIAIEAADIASATAYVSRFELGLLLPDAIHIATAQRLGLTLVSTDLRQVRAAGSLGIAAINPLHTDGNEP